MKTFYIVSQNNLKSFLLSDFLYFLITIKSPKIKKPLIMSGMIFKWCLGIDSNYRPYGYEPYALAN